MIFFYLALKYLLVVFSLVVVPHNTRLAFKMLGFKYAASSTSPSFGSFQGQLPTVYDRDQMPLARPYMNCRPVRMLENKARSSNSSSKRSLSKCPFKRH